MSADELWKWSATDLSQAFGSGSLDPVKVTQACLERMQGSHALVKPGGILVMTTPLSWLEEYTPRSRWMNGREAIAQVLSEFDCIHQAELPFLIREHRRKFEYIITQASVWRKK